MLNRHVFLGDQMPKIICHQEECRISSTTCLILSKTGITDIELRSNDLGYVYLLSWRIALMFQQVYFISC